MDTNRPLGSGPASPASPPGTPGAAMPPARPPQGAPAQTPGLNPKIQHTRSGIGQPTIGGAPHSPSHMEETLKPVSRLNPDNRPLPVEEAGLPGVGNKITAFGKDKRHEESWARTPNTTGQGAIHVKTFHCKLTDEALVYMDQLINEWLDAHPQYEVKFCISTIGTFTGKLKEPALICQVWV